MTAALDVMLLIAVALLDTVRGDSVSDYGAQDTSRILNSELAGMAVPGWHPAKLSIDAMMMLTLGQAGRAQAVGVSAGRTISADAHART